jgi:hypothetical protein
MAAVNSLEWINGRPSRLEFNNKIYPQKNLNASVVSPRNSVRGGGGNGSVGMGSKQSKDNSAANSEDSARTDDKTA